MTTTSDASARVSEEIPAARATLRFFAAARAAVGRDSLDLDLPVGSTIADALAAVVRQLAGPASPVATVGSPASPHRAAAARSASDGGGDASAAARHAEAVFRRCSFLVNGVAVTDHARTLDPDDRVDVMPPFAGG